MVMFLLNGGCHNGLISFGKRPWNTKFFIWRIDSLYEIESVKFNAVQNGYELYFIGCKTKYYVKI